ncbi:MAG: OmpA family protein [Phaeodactylibacter sp.]|nr:OmpA family protein [Phaeodactylibacter sp.]
MKNIPILILLFLLGGSALMAQPIRKSSYEQTLRAARESFQTRNYVYALERYEEAYEDKEDRSLIDTIAWLNFQIRDYRKAERWFARILRRAEEGELNEYRYIYGQLLKMNEKYDEALEEFQKFLDHSSNDSLNTLAKTEMAGAELAKELPQTMKGVTVENAGRDLNTKVSEYSPALASNGQEVYFTTFDANDVIYVDEKNKDESYALIYKAAKDDNGWEKPKALGGEINRPEFHNSNVSLSKDGRTMYFTRAQLEGNVLSESRIYFSTGGGEGWKGAQEVQGVNGEYLAKHPAIGELFGKEVLFFVANIPGGYGGFDIYYATKTGEGTFADPVNLGETINTIGDDETPYYRDGTLYFSSTGHPGLGGFDIFYSTWDGTKWSEPANMGRGFNTSVDDQSLTLDDEGYFGILVSNRPEGRSAYGRTCCNDLYTFSIAKLYADLVTGLFTIDKKPLPGGTVFLIPTQNNKPGTPDSKNSPEGNRFDFDLELEMPYTVIATHPDYFPDTMQFNTVGLTESKTFQHFFYLKPKPKLPEYDTITIEEPIVLENILYDFDDDRIRTEAESDLEVVYELMTEYPDMKIELSSHTDNRGNDKYNEELSQRRAESARRWLVRKGIDRERIVAKGYGEGQPQTVSARVAALRGFLKEGDVLTGAFIDALQDEGQQEIAHELNRRTEFKIIEGPTSITIKSTRLRKKESTTPGTDRGSLIGEMQQDTAKVHRLSSLYGKKNLKGVPVMYFSKRMVELGTVKKGEKRHFTYAFVNTGDAPLTISLISACDCTTIENDPTGDTFHPGQKGIIEVTFDSSEKDEAEEIDIDIFLEEEDNDGIPIRETVQYRFDIKK